MNYEKVRSIRIKKASRGQYKKKTGYGTIIALQAIRRSDPQCRLSDLAVHVSLPIFIYSAVSYFLFTFNCLIVMHVYCSLHAM